MYHKHKPKDTVLAEEYRDKAALLYKQSKFYDALECYNKCLCFAEGESESLALAYGARSAVYMDLKEYDKCLENIELALDAGYPRNKIFRLTERRLHAKLSKQREKVRLLFNDEDPWNFFHINAPHKKYPSIADCLTIQTDEKYGRHIVTTKDLRPGEIIAIEDTPFKSLNEGGVFSRCANCFKTNKLSLIPLETCASAMFCSHACLAYGRDKYMCAVDEETSIAPRIVLEALEMVGGNPRALKNLMAKPEASNRTIIEYDTSNPKDKSTKYDRLMAFSSLRPHKLSFTDCDFFMAHPILNRWTELSDKLIISECLISIAGRARNGMANTVEQMWCKENDGSYRTAIGPISVCFGLSIYLFASFFNHSCVPNTEHIQIDNKLVFLVTLPVKKGEQLFISYGPLLPEPLTSRQKLFTGRYNFTCTCIACVNDWKMSDFKQIDTSFSYHDFKFVSIEAAKERFLRQSEYIRNHHKSNPCHEIRFCLEKNQKLLSAIAKNEKFLFDKMHLAAPDFPGNIFE